MDIAASKASINTVSVEIRVLKVGGSKMTISVFKQLPERTTDLKHEKARLWGLVRNMDGYSLQLVYELDGILYRTSVWEVEDYEFEDAEKEVQKKRSALERVKKEEAGRYGNPKRVEMWSEWLHEKEQHLEYLRNKSDLYCFIKAHDVPQIFIAT